MEASRASRSAPRALSLRDPTLLDPAYTAGLAPMTFAQTILRPSGLTPSPNPLVTASLAPAPAPAPEPPLVQAQAALSDAARDPLPLPPARPAASPLAAETMPPLTGRRRMAQEASKPAALVRPADPRSVFDRMFGATPRPDAALAYAAPEEGSLGLFGAARGGGDRWTAVYDIAAHTVTLPDGTRLEAHSGLGAWLDDPRGVTEHMRGATPPNLYELEPREQLFHGVRALRLNPVGGTTYGRVGLLAHTFMLGPRGDSNGCVVFRDYKTFRQAYDNGQVRRLKVVARGG